MLIRKQIVLDAWLVDHLRHMGKSYGLSFSMIVRVLLYCYLINVEDKTRTTGKYHIRKCFDTLAAYGRGSISKKDFNRFCSDLAFEV